MKCWELAIFETTNKSAFWVFLPLIILHEQSDSIAVALAFQADEPVCISTWNNGKAVKIQRQE